ncbi:MAG: acyl-CoA dehydrogenase family protein [Burkholderiales bacterium]
MNVKLTEEQQAWQSKARKFAEEELRPISLDRDRISDPRETFDWDIIRKGSRLGFRTAVVAKEWGGHGIDTVTQALVMAELARGDSAIGKTFSQCWKWSHQIADFCTEEQKRRFLKPFVEDDTYLLGNARTEPNAGSDHRLPPEEFPKLGFSVKAHRDGDEWVLNGEKCFMANGCVAKLFSVSARTDPDRGFKDGSTEFMVPVGTPGFRIGKVFNKSGWRFYQNAELIFENARVPHENVLGEVNGCFKLRAGMSAAFGDLELSANALGVCQAAVDMALEHGTRRSPAARYILDNQTIQLKLSEMMMHTEALRSFVLRVAAEVDDRRNRHDSVTHVLLHNYSCDVIQKVTQLNLDIHANAGTTAMSARADKLVRDAIIWTHLAGDSVQRMKAARRLKLD